MDLFLTSKAEQNWHTQKCQTKARKILKYTKDFFSIFSIFTPLFFFSSSNLIWKSLQPSEGTTLPPEPQSPLWCSSFPTHVPILLWKDNIITSISGSTPVANGSKVLNKVNVLYWSVLIPGVCVCCVCVCVALFLSVSRWLSGG